MQTNPDVRWKQRCDNFSRALHQLTLARELAQTRVLSDLEQQGVIQGFEIVHELAWNMLRDYLEYEGIQGIVGSRGAVREAFKRGLLAEGQLWMDMIDKRNLTSHTYNPTLARELVNTIFAAYCPAYLALQAQMQGRM